MRRRDGHIIWPAYFEKNYSRQFGRRVPLNLAVENVSLKKLQSAVHALGYSFVIDPDAKYPARWWEQTGRLIVRAKISKNKLIKQIASKLKR